MSEPSLHWNPIATAIGTLLRTALGSGPKIYTNVRWTNKSDQFKALFVNTSLHTLNVWFVTRETHRNARGGDPAGRQLQVGFGEIARVHNVQIEGFHAFRGDGSSQSLFDEQVDLVSDLFTEQLSIMSNTVFLVSPNQGNMTLEEFGPALCHSTRLTMDAIIRVPATYVQA